MSESSSSQKVHRLVTQATLPSPACPCRRGRGRAHCGSAPVSALGRTPGCPGSSEAGGGGAPCLRCPLRAYRNTAAGAPARAACGHLTWCWPQPGLCGRDEEGTVLPRAGTAGHKLKHVPICTKQIFRVRTCAHGKTRARRGRCSQAPAFCWEVTVPCVACARPPGLP